MFNALKKLIKISRPISWPNTAYPFAAGCLVTGGTFDLFFIVATLFFLIPYNLLMYGINDVFDYESDMKNPRKGGIEGAREQKNFHPVIMWSSCLLTVPFVLWLLMYGDRMANAVLVALLFFVVAYSVKGLRFKEVPILDSITSSIHFVGPLLYAVTITGFHGQHLPYLLAFFLWGMASHALGAVQDIIPDRKAGIASVATVLGARRTTGAAFAFYLIVGAILISRGFVLLPVGCMGLLYALNVFPYLTLTDKSSQRVNRAWRRFIWLNLWSGFVVTITLIVGKL